MRKHAHLWAVRYEDTERAEQVRNKVIQLGERHCLILLDTAVVVRYPDGSVTLDGELYVPAAHFSGHTLASLLAGLALAAPPLTGVAGGAWAGHRSAAGPTLESTTNLSPRWKA